MIQQVNFNDFQDAFSGQYKDNFSYEGKLALFDYLEEFERDTGEPLELDSVAIACDYTEYKNLKELQENYRDIKSMEDLENNTTVIPIDGSNGFIIQDY